MNYESTPKSQNCHSRESGNPVLMRSLDVKFYENTFFGVVSIMNYELNIFPILQIIRRIFKKCK